jgi:hypothetical protein
VRLHCILIKTYHRIIYHLAQTVGRYSESSLLCEEWRYNAPNLSSLFLNSRILYTFIIRCSQFWQLYRVWHTFLIISSFPPNFGKKQEYIFKKILIFNTVSMNPNPSVEFQGDKIFYTRKRLPRKTFPKLFPNISKNMNKYAKGFHLESHEKRMRQWFGIQRAGTTFRRTVP